MGVVTETPSPKPWGVSAEEAVQLCREWMVHLGAGETLVSATATAGVCDLYSASFLGWVENRSGNLGIALVERVAAISARDGRTPLLFVPGGVFPEARERADSLGVALMRFRAKDGALDGVNALGRHFRAVGLVGR